MDIIVLWWHWVAIGLTLMLAELVVGTFVLFGLGVAGVVTGILVAMSDGSPVFGLITYSILSVLFVWVWMHWHKPPRLSTSGQSNDAIAAEGVAAGDIPCDSRGVVKFTTPLLGATKWTAVNDDVDPIKKGTRVVVTKVNGQLIHIIAKEAS